MRRIITFFLFATIAINAKSQAVLSYTCPRDTILGCNNPTLTIKSKIPNLRGLADDYTLNDVTPISSCRPYDPPQGPLGPVTDILLDDRYSSIIDLPFPFPFYGVYYNRLVVSGNGYISFDLGNANQFSHWDLSPNGTFVNLPSDLYDQALICGPLHDIDISDNTPANQSPNRKIKYNQVGTAPNRRWVLSFYKIPLYGTACDNQVDNTHQIVLHESTGLIEVFVQEREICTGWNDGKAMIGLQDMSRTKGLMAPGRRATDVPWGGQNLNEVWRFFPKRGAPLFRKVELWDQNNNLIRTNTDTFQLDENTYEVTFLNVTPPAGNTTYVIKTTYQQINDPNGVIINADTLRVIKVTELPLRATSNPSTCGAATGNITIIAAGTAPYTFYYPSRPPQTSNIITNLPSGPHTIRVVDNTGCENTITVNIDAVSNLPSTYTTTRPTCNLSTRRDGTITLTPTAGAAPFTFILSGGTPRPNQTSDTAKFTNLAPGTYSIQFRDANNCTGTKDNIVVEPGLPLQAQPTTTLACGMTRSGSLTVSPSGGTAPYTYTMTGYSGPAVPAGNTGTFGQLLPGTYSPTFTDVTGCIGTLTNVVVSFQSNIQGDPRQVPATCQSANNGSITYTPTSGSLPYRYTLQYASGPLANQPVPSSDYTMQTTPNTGTVNYTNLFPGDYQIFVQDAGSCTGTRGIRVTFAGGVTGYASSSPETCPGAADGTIFVTVNSGTPPFQYAYALPPYTTYTPFQSAASANATFTGMASGFAYRIKIRDANGCESISNIFGTVNSANPNGLTGATTQAFPTSCPGANNGIIKISPSATMGVGPFEYSIDNGTTYLPAGGTNDPFTFGGLTTTNTYTIKYRKVGTVCTGQVTGIQVPAGAAPTTDSVVQQPNCFGINDGSITINPVNPGAPNDYTYTLIPVTPPGAPIPQLGNVFSNLAPGTYSYNYRSASSGCVGQTETVTLTTNPEITNSFTPTQPKCKGDANGSILLTAGGGASSTYTYSIDGTTYQNSTNFTGLAAGSHTFWIKDDSGCVKSFATTLGEPTLLEASADTSSGTCNGNDGKITVSGTGGTSPYSYSVNNGISYQSIDSFKVNGGTYPDVLVKDANGCIARTNVTVTLIDNMTVTPANDTVVCEGSTVRLLTQFSPQANVFTWSVPADALLDSTISNTSERYALVKPTDTTTYAVKAQWGPCVRYDEIRVNVLHKPEARAEAFPNAICKYDSTILVGATLDSSGAVKYRWEPAILAVNPDQSTTEVFPLTTAVFSLIVTDDYNCNFKSIDTVKVTVQPPVPVNAGRDTIAQRGVVHQLVATASPDVVEYAWTPASLLNNASILLPKATLQSDQLFILTVKDFAGCRGKDSVLIRVYNGEGNNQPTYYVPNSFSPNGDGLNEIFRAVPVGIASTEFFRVYNRNGKVIFETKSWMKGWDGSFNGMKQPSGTYVWIVKGTDVNGKPVMKKGTVLLLR
jgi:gliding motility-associated-like protein